MKHKSKDIPKSASEVRQQLSMKNLNFQGVVLPGESFTSTKLNNADFSRSDLSGVTFHESTLDGAVFVDANLSRAQLGKPNFNPNVTANGQPFYPGNVCAKNCDFRKADLSFSDLSDADLTGADFRGANLRQANLNGANITKAKFDRSGKFWGIKGLDTTSGNPLFCRFAKDQEYIEAFKHSHPIRYALWSAISDCGRSFLLWFSWCVIIVSSFGCLFSRYPNWLKVSEEPTGFTYYYFSAVTFTTLGFGDIIPKTLYGEVAVVIEVFLGYFMLGMLITLAANKWARRS